MAAIWSGKDSPQSVHSALSPQARVRFLARSYDSYTILVVEAALTPDTPCHRSRRVRVPRVRGRCAARDAAHARPLPRAERHGAKRARRARASSGARARRRAACCFRTPVQREASCVCWTAGVNLCATYDRRARGVRSARREAARCGREAAQRDGRSSTRSSSNADITGLARARGWGLLSAGTGGWGGGARVCGDIAH